MQFAITVYWNATFGLWTLLNFFMMVRAPAQCGAVPFSLIKLSYHILLIIGAFPSIMFLLGIFFLGCFIPYYCVNKVRRTAERRAERARTKQMLKSLFRVEYGDGTNFTF